MKPYPRRISIHAKDAGCDRSAAPVVRGASFDLTPGEAIQLFGRNGSGKTSLLYLLAGQIPSTEGDLQWRMAEGDTRDAPFDDSIFFLGHEVSVKPALTVKENLAFWARLYDLSHGAERQIAEAIDELNLGGLRDVRAGRLSAGQRRRVDLARALLPDREIWLMDEPSAALDTDGAGIVSAMIGRHLDRGGVAVIATHDDLEIASRKLELR